MGMVPESGFSKARKKGGFATNLCWSCRGQKRRKRKIVITGVPYGRTELSLRLSGSKFGALSHGHGPRVWFLQGKEKTVGLCNNLCWYCLGQKRRKRKIDITGVPFGRTELSLRLSGSKFGALSHGHGPRVWFF